MLDDGVWGAVVPRDERRGRVVRGKVHDGTIDAVVRDSPAPRVHCAAVILGDFLCAGGGVCQKLGLQLLVVLVTYCSRSSFC